MNSEMGSLKETRTDAVKMLVGLYDRSEMSWYQCVLDFFSKFGSLFLRKKAIVNASDLRYALQGSIKRVKNLFLGKRVDEIKYTRGGLHEGR